MPEINTLDFVLFFILVIFAIVDMNYEFILGFFFSRLSILCSFKKDMCFQNFYLLIK